MFHAAITKVFPAKIGNWSWCHRFSFDKAHTEYWNTETWKGSISSWKLIYLAKKMLPVVLYFYDKIKIHYRWIFENAEIFCRYIEPKFWIPGDLYWWSWTALGNPTLEFEMSMGSWWDKYKVFVFVNWAPKAKLSTASKVIGFLESKLSLPCGVELCCTKGCCRNTRWTWPMSVYQEYTSIILLGKSTYVSFLTPFF